jgi:hypothetical protein
MSKRVFDHRLKTLIGICAAAFFAAFTIMSFGGKAVYARENLDEASYCSFVIPPEFVPGSEKGLFINKNHPMESSTIRYGVYDNGRDRIYTNREKKEAAFKAQAAVTDETTSLTKEIYQETIASAYNSEYGQDVGYKVEAFSKITIDGFPGYKITGTYQPEGEEVIHQTVYLVVSKYRTFTITMQRAEDDDCEEFFEECASSIHVH